MLEIKHFIYIGNIRFSEYYKQTEESNSQLDHSCQSLVEETLKRKENLDQGVI